MFKDTLKLKGRLQITMYRGDGTIEKFDFQNLVVNVGKTWVAARMVANTAVVMGWLAVGTSTTPPAAGDTVLGTEIARVAFDSAGSAGPVVTYQATFGPGIGTGALTEAGLLNNATPGQGTLLSHVNYPVVNKGAADTMAVQWTITVT